MMSRFDDDRRPSAAAAAKPALKTRIYVDNAATTKIRQSALSVYTTTCTESYGNPSSQHSAGRSAHEVLEWAREVHSRMMNVPRDTVYFTSSGTESNNIAIRGVLSRARTVTGREMILTTSVEHSSVRRTAELASGAKGNHLMVPVGPDGHVLVDAFRDVLRENASQIAMISIILAQNEVGTMQRIPVLSKIARDIVGPNVIIHTDATQAFGKYFIDPEFLGVDLLTASAHKYHGPRGVGILYARAGVLDPNVLPITGGGQERGCRSGTENVPAIAAAASALESMLSDQKVWMDRKIAVGGMRDCIIDGLTRSIPGIKINGDPKRGLYNLASITLPSVDGLEVIRRLDADGIAVGSGSACNRGRPSETLIVMGRTADEALRTIRISLSEFNTPAECAELVDAIVRVWRTCIDGVGSLGARRMISNS
jgi:cysteine desulfurase